MILLFYENIEYIFFVINYNNKMSSPGRPKRLKPFSNEEFIVLSARRKCYYRKHRHELLVNINKYVDINEKQLYPISNEDLQLLFDYIIDLENKQINFIKKETTEISNSENLIICSNEEELDNEEDYFSCYSDTEVFKDKKQ
jgi:hypothetical protein